MRLNSEIIVTIIGDYFSNYYSKFIMKKKEKEKKKKKKKKKNKGNHSNERNDCPNIKRVYYLIQRYDF